MHHRCPPPTPPTPSRPVSSFSSLVASHHPLKLPTPPPPPPPPTYIDGVTTDGPIIHRARVQPREENDLALERDAQLDLHHVARVLGLVKDTARRR